LQFLCATPLDDLADPRQIVRQSVEVVGEPPVFTMFLIPPLTSSLKKK
jgi:hypothetical protein